MHNDSVVSPCLAHMTTLGYRVKCGKCVNLPVSGDYDMHVLGTSHVLA